MDFDGKKVEKIITDYFILKKKTLEIYQSLKGTTQQGRFITTKIF
jgi:hypothetical protein